MNKTKTLPNQDIRKLMKKNGISQNDLSIKLGVCTETVFRHLRKKMDIEEKEAYKKAINEIIEEKKKALKIA